MIKLWSSGKITILALKVSLTHKNLLYYSIYLLVKMVTTGTVAIILFIAGVVIGIFGYFLKMIHSDVRKNTTEIGKAHGKIDLVEQEHRLKYQALVEQTQTELKNLALTVNKLAAAVEKLILKQIE
jgi:hypothetical protein